MSAETGLAALLAGLSAVRRSGVWRFETSSARPGGSAVLAFQEREGWTAILPADETTSPDNRWVWLEMSVQSDLNAVGFLAAIAKALAGAGVPCNAVAGFYHDHIFVPENQADIAIEAIDTLAGKG